MAKMPVNSIVCGICREIIEVKNSKEFISGYDWGSISGTPYYGNCCKEHKLKENKEVPGRTYA